MIRIDFNGHDYIALHGITTKTIIGKFHRTDTRKLKPDQPGITYDGLREAKAAIRGNKLGCSCIILPRVTTRLYIQNEASANNNSLPVVLKLYFMLLASTK